MAGAEFPQQPDGGSEAPQPPSSHEPIPPHSKAYENFVQGDDDLEGLLAYALYKSSIREQLAAGSKPDNARRDPPPTLVAAFRSNAAARLIDFAQGVLDEYSDEADSTAATNAMAAVGQHVQRLHDDLRNFVRSRTKLWHGVLASAIGWALTLALTVLILLALQLPDLARSLGGLIAPRNPPAAGG